jgi:hypothetical protein
METCRDSELVTIEGAENTRCVYYFHNLIHRKVCLKRDFDFLVIERFSFERKCLISDARAKFQARDLKLSGLVSMTFGTADHKKNSYTKTFRIFEKF